MPPKYQTGHGLMRLLMLNTQVVPDHCAKTVSTHLQGGARLQWTEESAGLTGRRQGDLAAQREMGSCLQHSISRLLHRHPLDSLGSMILMYYHIWEIHGLSMADMYQTTCQTKISTLSLILLNLKKLQDGEAS